MNDLHFETKNAELKNKDKLAITY